MPYRGFSGNRGYGKCVIFTHWVKVYTNLLAKLNCFTPGSVEKTCGGRVFRNRKCGYKNFEKGKEHNTQLYVDPVLIRLKPSFLNLL